MEGAGLAVGCAGRRGSGNDIGYRRQCGGTATAYNNNGGNTAAGWRYGFVAIVDGAPQYASMNKGKMQGWFLIHLRSEQKIT